MYPRENEREKRTYARQKKKKTGREELLICRQAIAIFKFKMQCDIGLWFVKVDRILLVQFVKIMKTEIHQDRRWIWTRCYKIIHVKRVDHKVSEQACKEAQQNYKIIKYEVRSILGYQFCIKKRNARASLLLIFLLKPLNERYLRRLSAEWYFSLVGLQDTLNCETLGTNCNAKRVRYRY